MSYFGFKKDINDDNDIHEMLKENILGSRKKYENETDINKEILHSLTSGDHFVMAQQYVLLDSFLKNQASHTHLGEYNWTLSTHNHSKFDAIRIYEIFDYVIEIQIGSFNLPMINDIPYIDPIINHSGIINLMQNNANTELNLAPTLVKKVLGTHIGQYPNSLFTNKNSNYIMPWINNPYSQVPFNNRITIQIIETGLQSYTNKHSSRFNFEFEVSYNSRIESNPNNIDAKPVNANGWDSFIFLHPIRNLSTISLVIRNPDIPINFEPDILYSSSIILTPDINTGGFHITIVTSSDHKLNGGDRIFLQNFIPKINNTSVINSNFPAILTSYINRQQGHVINSVFGDAPVNPGEPITTSKSFSLDPSVHIINEHILLINESFPGTVDVCIAKRRLRIPMKIKYLKNKDNKKYVFD